jgi:uncharacterized membrane protein
VIALARALDASAVGIGAMFLGIVAFGGFRLAGVGLTRPENLVVALAAIVGIRTLLVPMRLPRVRAERVVAAGLVAYVALMTFVSLTRHRALRSHALDLGQYLQVIWNIAEGHGPMTSMPPVHFWGEHLSPIFYLLAPLEWLWRGPAPLLVAQTVILAAGAVAVFLFARVRLNDAQAAAGLALLYLANPSLHGINLRDIHPQAFAIPLLLAAALAFETSRYAWCAVAIALTLACREDAAVAVVGFGVWLGMARGRWLSGAAVAAASVAVLILDLNVVMPYFRGAAYPHLHRYAHLGGSIGEILSTVVARPWRWLAVVVSGPKLLYLAAMLAPLGFLPVAAPRALAAAVPGLAINLLALDPVLINYRTQYQSFVLPFLVLAAVDGYGRLGELGPWRERRWPLSPPAVLAVAFMASLILTARTANDLGVSRWRTGPLQDAAYALLARVPPAAVVSANERLVPHLALRPEVFIFPSGIPQSEYVIDLRTVAAKVPPGYEVVAEEGPWALWRRAVIRPSP